MKKNEVGVFLSSWRNTAGEYAAQVIADDWEAVREQLGGTASVWDKDGRKRIGDSLRVGSLNDPEERAKAFQWLGSRVNTFVNVLRPRVRAAVADYVSQQDVS